MLVKKCGLDAVKAVMPQEHMKLLTNIRKVVAIDSVQVLNSQGFSLLIADLYLLLSTD